MARSAFAAACILLFASVAAAQNCNLSGTGVLTQSCTSPIRPGSSSRCTVTLTNTGSGPCSGNWGGAVGALDAGTVSNGTSNFGSCSVVTNYPLPAPAGNFTSISTAFLCQGTNTLAPGATFTVSADVTPAPTLSGPVFYAGYAAAFQSNAMVGTTSFSGWGSNLVLVQNCTAVPSVAGAAPSALPYVVSWNSTGSGGPYEIQEATLSDFSNASTITEPSTSHVFQHTVGSATTFFYRVRPVTCSGSPGVFGPLAQIVILPQQSPASRDFDIIVPAGTENEVSQDVKFSGLPPHTAFSVTTDKPYLSVNPSTGVVGSDGTATVTVIAGPSGLPVGANTGTVILTLSSAKGSAVPLDSRSTTTTVSISLVTPVNSTPRSGSSDSELIVPAVAHLEGAAVFRSDIRITNTDAAPATYLLTFTPQNTDGTTSGKQTTITVQPDQTVALNDVLKDFFGFAQPSDAAGGVLDIRIVTGSPSKTFVSSRTYALDPVAGTYGQFIPAVAVSKFLKAGTSSLTLTQIAQSASFRTNIGLVEGLGANASGHLKVFDTNGFPLGDPLGYAFTLRPFEFQQLGQFLLTKSISAPDARIELVVDSPTGGVTTYASVLDNKTNDPLLVSPIQQGTLTANRYVLPGMADFASAVSNFHSDIRVYNASNLPVNATATFYPQIDPSHPSPPIVRALNIAAGEIKVYNNVLPTLFGTSGAGAIVITTPNNVPLVVSGRTYSNAAAGGTYGQFIPAVTPADGVGLGDPPLQVLQLEQSANFRSNLGLNELTGNPVTVHVSAILPDSKTAVGTDVPLAANEFKQLGSILAQLNPGNTYNARITVAVVSGTGRVTAYGSVVDNLTTDPTYVPAQK